jgi:hypothetical protein
LTPAATAGIAILCCILGVFGTQLAARAWRAADANVADERAGAFALAHARAAAGRARALAEAAQFSAAVLLVTAGCIALYAVAPGLPTEGIGGLALAGCVYLVGDAVLSYMAELRRLADDEKFDDFMARTAETGPDRWAAFTLSEPAAAKRILRRRPGAPEDPMGQI